MPENPINNQLTDGEVTAHTASMWKYTPIPESPEPFPEFRNSYADHGDYTVTAASVRGKKHKHDGTNCDDWFETEQIGGWIIAAVSDGAGSKKYSRIGAKAACTSFVSEVKAAFMNAGQEEDLTASLSLPIGDEKFMKTLRKLTEIMQNAFLHAADAVEAEFFCRKDDPEYFADGEEPKLSDFACTLVTCSVIPLNKDEQLVIAIQAGDGMVCEISPSAGYENALTLLGNADSGDFSGETEFITSSKMRNIAAVQSRTKLKRSARSAVLLMSDGIADDYYPNSPKLLSLWTDLTINGIIPKFGDASEEKSPVCEENVWVNDRDIKYNIAYSDKTAESMELSPEKFWEMRNSFAIPADTETASALSGTPDEKLKTWLDSYLKRGSFDDRTLAVILPGGEV